MIDTAVKRKSLSGVPAMPLIPGVTPNAAKPFEWRAASAWGYALTSTPPPPTGDVFDDKFGIGLKTSLHISGPSIGGSW